MHNFYLGIQARIFLTKQIHNIIYLLNKRFLFRNDRFRYLKLSRKALWTACAVAVLKREAMLLSAFARCADPFACLVMSSEWCRQMKEWLSEHHANLSPFSQRLMESSKQYIYILTSGKWACKWHLIFFFFVDVDVTVFSTCLTLRIQKAM